MEPRYDTRLKEMLAQAEVPPDQVDGVLARLERFVLPFAASLARVEQRRHALEYLTGLLSNTTPLRSSSLCAIRFYGVPQMTT
jgi:hypothetical protein